MSGSIKKFVDYMDLACRIWSLGYDQSNRWDIRNGGECDCSSLVIWALRKAGFDTGGATYTGNLSSNLVARGWKRIAPNLSTARPGDILLNDTHHVCVVVSGFGNSAIIAQASIDERGRASGGRSGDQSAYETNEKRIYTYRHGWNCILRFDGGGSDASVPSDDEWFAGRKTFSRWQAACGTFVDGVMSGQYKPNLKYTPNFVASAMTFDGTGNSALVKHVQGKVGVKIDGFFGHDTVVGVQRFLVSHGFSVGDSGADGIFGSDSVHALCESLSSSNNIWR